MKKQTNNLKLRTQIAKLHRQIRDRVLRQTRVMSIEAMSEVVAEQGGDVIFAIDKDTEKTLLDFCEKELYPEFEFVLIAEGLPGNGAKLFSKKSHPDEAPHRIIIDPIDGTRLLMNDKRSAWILTGVAANGGDTTSLKDIFFAMQTEIPTTKQTLADMLWAFRGQPANALRENLSNGENISFAPTPSQAKTLRQGFASFVHFFHGGKEVISRIDETLCKNLYGKTKAGQAWTFEDQYMSTGGQIYELSVGHDRLIVDLRAFLGTSANESKETGLCCHPYDICTELIARAAGVIITNEKGEPLDAPLDVTTNIDWIGYANENIRKHVEPALTSILANA